jgi:nucleolar protein 14
LITELLKAKTDLEKPNTLPKLGRFKVPVSIRDFKLEPETIKMSEIIQDKMKLSPCRLISLLLEALGLAVAFFQNYADVASVEEASATTILLLKQIPHKEMSKTSQIKLDQYAKQLMEVINKGNSNRTFLALQKRKALAMKTYNPKFDENYSIESRRRDPDRQRQMKAKEAAEYKRERKGAIRELRKDAHFIARNSIAEKKAKDAEYKKKMDKIMGQLASQEGSMRGYERELKKIKRK